MNQAAIYDVASILKLGAGLAPQSASTGVAITTGDVIDRSAVNYPYSAMLVISGSFHTSGAASGDKIAVEAVVKTSAAVGMTSPTTLVDATVNVPWKSNGSLREFQIAVPVNLNAALEFIQLSSLTLTVTTVGTLDTLVVGAAFVFGGEQVLPDPAYAKAGYLGFST